MEIVVKTVSEEAYDCYLIAIATVLNSMDKEFHMISTGYWGFEYIPLNKREDRQIGNGFFSYERRNAEGEKIFHGIDLNILYKAREWQANQGHLVKDIIEMILNHNRIVVIVSDAYWYSWSTYYRKKHCNHCYLIYGVDNGIYKCLDPYVNNLFFDETYEKLNLDEACKYVIDISSEDKQIDRKMVLDVLKKDHEYMQKRDIIKQIQLLIQDVDEYFVYENEINGDIDQKIISPLVENIRFLIRNRQGYLLMLKHLNDFEHYDFCDSIDFANQCINNWKKLRFILIKNIYHNTKKDIKTMILTILESIRDSEQLFNATFYKEIISNLY